MNSLRVGFILVVCTLVPKAGAEENPVDYEKSHAIYAPKPDYPEEARAQRLTGSGIAVLEVDISTGKVKRVEMVESTGHDLLDRGCVTAFRAWRFKPGTVARAKIPITFTIGGAGPVEFKVVRSRPMDQVLAPFLGKGTVLNAPIPQYPKFPPWHDKEGKGIYELHVDKEGKVADVKVLKSSADAAFDRESVRTLLNWRLRKGPLVVQLPLAFKLTSDRYRVWIP